MMGLTSGAALRQEAASGQHHLTQGYSFLSLGEWQHALLQKDVLVLGSAFEGYGK
jgi:hypothetical protein